MFCWKKKITGNWTAQRLRPWKSLPPNCAVSLNESSKIRIHLYHSAEAANGKTANPKMTNEKISSQIGHVKSQQCRQQISISAQRSEVIMLLFPHKNWLPLEHGKLKTVWISDDIERDTDEIRGLEEVSAEHFTEATLLTQPFNWTQQLHTNKSSQSNWICSNTGSHGVYLLELVTHPPAMTNTNAELCKQLWAGIHHLSSVGILYKLHFT